ncbi:iron chaperone [Promineifilum sp.]|uniref:iron chaperone n=1 Tax=Promineifilum sp. TaxID=2664178 RepID=UPI0035AE14CC
MDTNQPTPKTIDEYIAGFSPDVQAILQQIRATIREEAPEARETIKYQMPTFVLNGNLVYFAAFKKHIGFYPTPTGTEHFQKEISGYKAGKGSIQFPLSEPMPFELIREIVRFRVEESREAAEAKKRKK